MQKVSVGLGDKIPMTRIADRERLPPRLNRWASKTFYVVGLKGHSMEQKGRIFDIVLGYVDALIRSAFMKSSQVFPSSVNLCKVRILAHTVNYIDCIAQGLAIFSNMDPIGMRRVQEVSFLFDI